MDISLVQTFLAIIDVGNFAKAAERLNLTQSTVSTRIKVLEDLLGQQLFVRLKSGAKLTAAGSQFQPYAEKLVQTWEHARMEVGLPVTFRELLVVGAEFTLWERILIRWIPWIRTALPDVAIRVGVGSSAHLMQQLVDGLIGVAVTYTPQYRSGLIIEKLMEESLVLVAKNPESKGIEDEDYIYVDLGPGIPDGAHGGFPQPTTTGHFRELRAIGSASHRGQWRFGLSSRADGAPIYRGG